VDSSVSLFLRRSEIHSLTVFETSRFESIGGAGATAGGAGGVSRFTTLIFRFVIGLKKGRGRLWKARGPFPHY
jgi:hypothetical protein